MHLDIPTILILHPLSLFIGACCFLYMRWRSRRSRGLGKMAVAFLMLGGGSFMAGAGVQGVVAYETWTLLSFASGPIAYALFWIGLVNVVTEKDAGANNWIYLLPVVLIGSALATGFYLIDVVRSGIFLVAMALTSLANGWLVLSDPQDERLTSRYGLAGALMFKTLVALVTTWAMLDPKAAGAWPAISFLLLILDQFAIAMFVLIMVQERAEQRLVALTETDRLTGVRNRHWLMDRLPREVAAGSAFVVIDIDHFKSVNDQHGHLAGDEVLVAVAQAMAMRNGADALFARLGGEEFGLYVPHTTETNVLACVELLRRTIEALPITHEARPIAVTISAGVSVADDVMPFTRLIAQADEALYEAKRGGRNRVVLFHCAGITPMPEIGGVLAAE
ncbi:hypothetical protein IP76_08505 [Rhizobium sp. AAP43]|nr:hypothetical protein IP76_08505 [Rhizobium sp. AAP43]